jgi:hypothetical protein
MPSQAHYCPVNRYKNFTGAVTPENIPLQLLKRILRLPEYFSGAWAFAALKRMFFQI